ncbi:MAG TPA: VWA domain-containing protein [Bacteroidia bacterium]|nr:VWA domain-containing protein [Bacteroidia bacterium]
MKTLKIMAATALGITLSSCGGSHHEAEQIQTMNYQIADVAACKSAPIRQEENTEVYSQITEEGFQSVTHAPYSTFAIDVDGASYSSMRRKILQGLLPAPNEVRIEEWINYFHYDYPQPYGNNPFSITTEYSACPWNTEHQLLHIGLKGKEIQMEKNKANHLVFLIDVSGSMQDQNKLPLLKRAFRLLGNKLTDDDRISLVVYAGAAGVLLKNEPGNHRKEIENALENLQAGGSTAGGEGIELAYKIAEEHFIEDGNNRIILATDGDFNVGISSEDELEKFIEEKRKKGVYLSVLGFGEGNIKDNIMETLADKGNGNYFYIDNYLEAQKVLVKQFGGTINTIAKDVKIQLEFNPKYVKEYRLIGYENRRLNNEDFNDDKKDAGELGSGHTVTALYEVVPAGSKETNAKVDHLKYQNSTKNSEYALELANIKFRYKNPGLNDTVSKLITQKVFANLLPEEKTSANFKMACAVTEFALVMRQSEYKGLANIDHAKTMIQNTGMADTDGNISELSRLMGIAKELNEQQVSIKQE